MRKTNKKQILAVGAAWLMALGMIGCQTAAPDPTETTGELLVVTTDATEPEKEAFVSSSRYQATLPTEPEKPAQAATEPTVGEGEDDTTETSTPGNGTNTGTGSSTGTETGNTGSTNTGNGNTGSNTGTSNPTPTTPASPDPAPTTPPVTTAPIEPQPTVCSHNWQEVWHDEEGHYGEPYFRCSCGFIFHSISEWDAHLSNYSGEEVIANHASYSGDADYIVDVPGYSTWVCTKCGATSDTQP